MDNILYVYLVPVDVVKPIEQHLHHLLYFSQCELHIGIAQKSRQVVLTEVKDKVYTAFVAVELCSCKQKER